MSQRFWSTFFLDFELLSGSLTSIHPSGWNERTATPAALPNVQHCCKNDRCLSVFLRVVPSSPPAIMENDYILDKDLQRLYCCIWCCIIFIHGYHNISHSKNDNLAQQTKKTPTTTYIYIYHLEKWAAIATPMHVLVYHRTRYESPLRTWEWRGEGHRSFHAVSRCIFQVAKTKVTNLGEKKSHVKQAAVVSWLKPVGKHGFKAPKRLTKKRAMW